MSRIGDFVAWLRFGGPATMTTMRDAQGNEMDPAVLEDDEPEDLKELDAEQTQRRRWAALTRPRRTWWPWWWNR